MAPSFFTVKDNFVQIDKKNRENARAKDDEILAMLASFREDIGELTMSTEPTILDPPHNELNMSRQIMIPTQTLLPQKKLQTLAVLYSEDQKLAKKLLVILERNCSALIGSSHLKNLMRSALREKLIE